MKLNWIWLVVGVALIMLLNFNATPQVQSVQNLQGGTCTVTTNAKHKNVTDGCPCWGSVGDTQAYGVGTGICKDLSPLSTNKWEGRCDMTWCVDVQPVGKFLTENPWQWLKNNIVVAVGILALSIFAMIYLPKR